MTREEAKKQIRYKSILFHDDGTVVMISNYIDEKSDIWKKEKFAEDDKFSLDEYMGYPNVLDKGGVYYRPKHNYILLLELESWHMATVEELQGNLLAYCNFLAYKQDKIFTLMEGATVNFTNNY